MSIPPSPFTPAARLAPATAAPVPALARRTIRPFGYAERYMEGVSAALGGHDILAECPYAVGTWQRGAWQAGLLSVLHCGSVAVPAPVGRHIRPGSGLASILRHGAAL